MFDFAFADGTNSFAEAEIGNFDVAVADGADSVAKAGFDAELIPGLLSPTSFDAALVFGGRQHRPRRFRGNRQERWSFSTSPPPLATICLAQAIVAPFVVDIVP